MTVSEMVRPHWLPFSQRKVATQEPPLRTSDTRALLKLDNHLLRYVVDHYRTSGLCFAERPSPVTDGWETYIYHFRLQALDALPAELSGPLTLRMFSGPRGIPRCRREFAVQSHIHALGYPVPRPLCYEADCAVLGGPFMIVEQIPGPTLLHFMLYNPLFLLPLVDRMVQMQLRLHALPAAGFPGEPHSLLDRSLDKMSGVIRRVRLTGLTPGLDWLSKHRPPPPRSPAIVHLDFHPRNIIYRRDQEPAVLDWDTADVGDPHADIATTLMLIRCIPNEENTLLERSFFFIGRPLLKLFYLGLCRRRMRLEDNRLNYYEAWAVLRRLCRYGECLETGPTAIGSKPAMRSHLRHDHVVAMSRYFGRLTGVRVGLGKKPFTA